MDGIDRFVCALAGTKSGWMTAERRLISIPSSLGKHVTINLVYSLHMLTLQSLIQESFLRGPCDSKCDTFRTVRLRDILGSIIILTQIKLLFCPLNVLIDLI